MMATKYPADLLNYLIRCYDPIKNVSYHRPVAPLVST